MAFGVSYIMLWPQTRINKFQFISLNPLDLVLDKNQTAGRFKGILFTFRFIFFFNLFTWMCYKAIT